MSLLAEGMAGPVNPRQQDFLEIVARNSLRIEFLLEDVNDLIRIEEGVQLVPRREPLDLRNIVTRAMKALERALETKALTVRVNLPDHGLPVEGDAGYLQRAIAHVFSNAVNFTPDSGEIRVRAWADLEPQGPVARLEFEDNGIGIPAGDLEVVFLPFGKAGNATRQVAGGLGLGLPVARALVEQAHQGRVVLASVEEQGTCVSLALPLTSAHETTCQILGSEVDRAGLDAIAMHLTRLTIQPAVPFSRDTFEMARRLAAPPGKPGRFMPLARPGLLWNLSWGDPPDWATITRTLGQALSDENSQEVTCHVDHAAFSGRLEEGSDFLQQARALLGADLPTR